jgi:hypothetical protein
VKEAKKLMDLNLKANLLAKVEAGKREIIEKQQAAELAEKQRMEASRVEQEEAERAAGKEAFILFIVANWKFHGDHFVKLNLKPLYPYCENDYKLVLKEF